METKKFEIFIETNELGYSMFYDTKKEISLNTILILDNLKQIDAAKDYLVLSKFFNLDEKLIQITNDKINFLNIYSLFLNFRCELLYNMTLLYLFRTPLEQNIHIRYIYLEIFRYIERFNKQENSKIEMLCETYKVKNDHNMFCDSRKEFKKKYKLNKIEDYRNWYSAHNHYDYHEYYDNIAEIDPTDVIQMCFRFIDCENIFYEFLKSLNDSLKNHFTIISKMLDTLNILPEEHLFSTLETRKAELTDEKYEQIKVILNKIFQKMSL